MFTASVTFESAERGHKRFPVSVFWRYIAFSAIERRW
ncbi:transposase domain protein [Burkholderia sp. MSHR3999]|nr:transposase domain protein [Burkholderia sp. MSHR3999]